MWLVALSTFFLVGVKIHAKEFGGHIIHEVCLYPSIYSIHGADYDRLDIESQYLQTGFGQVECSRVKFQLMLFLFILKPIFLEKAGVHIFLFVTRLPDKNVLSLTYYNNWQRKVGWANWFTYTLRWYQCHLISC